MGLSTINNMYEALMIISVDFYLFFIKDEWHLSLVEFKIKSACLAFNHSEADANFLKTPCHLPTITLCSTHWAQEGYRELLKQHN